MPAVEGGYLLQIINRPSTIKQAVSRVHCHCKDSDSTLQSACLFQSQQSEHPPQLLHRQLPPLPPLITDSCHPASHHRQLPPIPPLTTMLLADPPSAGRAQQGSARTSRYDRCQALASSMPHQRFNTRLVPSPTTRLAFSKARHFKNCMINAYLCPFERNRM